MPWSEIVTTALTVVLILITGYYAVYTRKMVDEMRQSRKLTTATLQEMQTARSLGPWPFISISVPDKQIFPNAPFIEAAYGHKYMEVTNIGNNLALRVKCRLVVGNDPQVHDEFFPAEVRIGSLVVAKTYYAHIEERRGGTSRLGHKKRIKIISGYENVYGRRFKTTSTFELIDREIANEYHWERLDEVADRPSSIRQV